MIYPKEQVHSSMVLLLRDAVGYQGSQPLVEAYTRSVKRLTFEIVKDGLEAKKRLEKK